MSVRVVLDYYLRMKSSGIFHKICKSVSNVYHHFVIIPSKRILLYFLYISCVRISNIWNRLHIYNMYLFYHNLCKCRNSS